MVPILAKKEEESEEEGMDVWSQIKEKSKKLVRSSSFNGVLYSDAWKDIKEKKLTRSKSLPAEQWSPSRITASAWKLLSPFLDPHRRKKMDSIQLGGKSESDKALDVRRIGVGGMDGCVGSSSISSSRTSYPPPLFREKEKKKNVDKKTKNKKKKKFSWWPDANQRWPVQGW